MATINSAYQLALYTNDFGRDITNVPVKFGNGVATALLTALGYTLRPANSVCSIRAGGFKLRRLVATFTNGETHEFPVNKANIVAAVNTLRNNGAVCIDLKGEKHSFVVPADIGTPAFSSSAGYTNIPNVGSKTSYTFDYTSDLLATPVELSAAIESGPAPLLAAQTACLSGLSTTQGVCSGAALGIEPRRLILQHRNLSVSGQTKKISRYIRVSLATPLALQQCANTTASAALCFGYQGESASRVEQIVP